MAQLRLLREQFPNELVVIGVHSAKFPTEQLTYNIRHAVLRHGIQHPVVNDADFKIWNAYTVRAWPTLVLIDPAGRIAGEVSGEISAETFAKEIQAVLDEHPGEAESEPFALAAPPEAEQPLRYPAKLLVSEDRLFVADTGHHRVIEARLDADGLGAEVLRVFGGGEGGFRDGSAEQAAFNQPHGLSLLGGALYVADTENHALRVVDLASGEVRTLAGTGHKGAGRYLRRPPLEMDLRSPWDVLALGQYVFIAMAGTHQVWVLLDEAQLGPFAGNGYEALVDGPLGEASFNQPSGLAFGLGYLFVADPEASAVRAISFSEGAQVVTLVGKGLFDWGDQDGGLDAALLQHPVGISFAEHKIYLADSYNHKIKVLDPLAGQVITLAGSGQPGLRDGLFAEAQFSEPEGLWVQGERVYVADTNNHQVRVLDLTRGSVHTLHLRGLERLPANAGPELLLDPLVVGPGQVAFTLEIGLPDGCKLNPDALSTLQVSGVAEAYAFASNEPLTWRQPMEEDRDLVLELTVYYCEAVDARLCRVHRGRLSVPLRVMTDGPNAVTIPYSLAHS